MKNHLLLYAIIAHVCAILQPSSVLADEYWYLKLGAGYLRANKYLDYTDGNKDFLDGIRPKSLPWVGIELGNKLNDYIRIGVAFEMSQHKYKKAALDDDSKISQEYFDLLTHEEMITSNIPYRIDKIRVRSFALLLNGYYAFPSIGNVKPYFMGGIGMVHHVSSDYNISICYQNISPACDTRVVKGKSTNSLAWNIGIGGELVVYDAIALDMSVRYFDYGRTKTKNETYDNSIANKIGHAGTQLNGMVVTTGLVYRF